MRAQSVCLNRLIFLHLKDVVNPAILKQAFVFPQRGGREGHAVPGLTDAEESGEARECRGHQHPETGTTSQRHGHW